MTKTMLGRAVTRRSALGGLALATGGVVAGRSPRLVAARQDGSVSSGGIGLDIEAWEDLHGPGEVGQSLASYEDGAYYVGLAGGVVVFLEFGWEDVGGVDFSDAVAAVESLVPNDARLMELYDLPPTAAGPAGMTVRRYESPALEDLLRGGSRALTGAIAAVFQHAPGLLDPPVNRVSIAVAQDG